MHLLHPVSHYGGENYTAQTMSFCLVDVGLINRVNYIVLTLSGNN